MGQQPNQASSIFLCNRTRRVYSRHWPFGTLIWHLWPFCNGIVNDTKLLGPQWDSMFCYLNIWFWTLCFPSHFFVCRANFFLHCLTNSFPRVKLVFHSPLKLPLSIITNLPSSLYHCPYVLFPYSYCK